MQNWLVICGWFANVLGISFVLAIFEILLEKNNGWGSGLNPNGLGRRLFQGTAFARILEKPYFTVYHIFMFLVIVPTGLAVEYFAVKSLGIADLFYFPRSGAPHAFLAAHTLSEQMRPLLYAVSVWFALVSVEDFLWFLMNWYYPNSLHELLSGNIWWHEQWISVGAIKLPRFYVTTAILAIALFAACVYII